MHEIGRRDRGVEDRTGVARGPRRALVALVLLWTVLSAAAGAGTACAATDEAEVLERYESAERAKERALVALERAYESAEAAVERWREDAESVGPFAESLVAPLRALEEEFRGERESAPAESPAQARRRQREEQERIHAAVLAFLESPERPAALLDGEGTKALATLVAQRVAAAVVAHLAEDDLAVRIENSLEGILEARVPFHELWNSELHLLVEESREYQARYNEYISAGVELDRLRHPEYYLEGGKRIRPGMVLVPGGTYTVGPNTGFERRRKRVSLRPYLIDQYEVSNADYLVFLESQSGDQRLSLLPRTWEPGPDGSVRPAENQRLAPVTGITWQQADAYARWAGKRLPTEDEWEVACRGKEAFAYPWGEQYLPDRCNDSRLGVGAPVDVRTMSQGASPFQVFHMAGNVEEWTASDEEGRTLRQLESSITSVVVRGGHYSSAPENVGGLFRWVAPGGSAREAFLGFRCAADLESSR